MASGLNGHGNSRNGPHIVICIRSFRRAGGATQCLMGLIETLGKLDDGTERYTLVADTPWLVEWLKPHCGRNQRIVLYGALGDGSGLRPAARRVRMEKVLRTVLAPLVPLARYAKRVLSPPRSWPEVPLSDGFIEDLGCDVVHFPAYWFMLCNVPSVYNPHDLQHRLYPQYISQEELKMREVVFPAACRISRTVVVGTKWVKDDVVRQFGIDPGKIQIIPWASPTQFYTEPSAEHLTTVCQKYNVEMPFAIFPAHTWPHKNHVRLLDALALLRDSKGLVVRLVCTGGPVDFHWPQIEARVRELKLESQVRFVGSIPDDDLRALYRLSQFLVMPTLYEADSNPIHEAWYEGVPVASSNVTALPDQVKDAGILFDPRDVRAIADAVARMATDEALREDLKQRGYRRAKDFSWERTAKAYRAVYRRAADASLTEEDRWLLQWDWLREPNKSREPVQ